MDASSLVLVSTRSLTAFGLLLDFLTSHSPVSVMVWTQ